MCLLAKKNASLFKHFSVQPKYLLFGKAFCIFKHKSINPADSVFVPGGQFNSLLDAALPSQA